MSDSERAANDDELSLPKATAQKLIGEFLPSDVTCGKDTRDLIVECCVEFIHLLASEANEICEKENKKTIAAEHIVEALKQLQFDEYLDDVLSIHEEHKQSVKHDRERKSSRVDNSGMSDEQLLKMQESLMAKAREQYMQNAQGGT